MVMAIFSERSFRISSCEGWCVNKSLDGTIFPISIFFKLFKVEVRGNTKGPNHIQSQTANVGLHSRIPSSVLYSLEQVLQNVVLCNQVGVQVQWRYSGLKHACCNIVMYTQSCVNILLPMSNEGSSYFPILSFKNRSKFIVNEGSTDQYYNIHIVFCTNGPLSVQLWHLTNGQTKSWLGSSKAYIGNNKWYVWQMDWVDTDNRQLAQSVQ